MCQAVRFQFEGKDFEPHFASARACVPVRMKNGQDMLVNWGRRPREKAKGPFGPGIRLSAIQAGVWDKLLPQPVKVAVQEFMEVDVAGSQHWFRVTDGQYLQGMLVREDNNSYRVYIVQLDCNSSDICFERWPRVVSDPF